MKKVQNGGTKNISKSWAESFICCMHFVKHKRNTACKAEYVKIFDKLISWRPNLVPVLEWTKDIEVALRVEISGERQFAKIQIEPKPFFFFTNSDADPTGPKCNTEQGLQSWTRFSCKLPIYKVLL